MATMPTRIDQQLFDAAKAAGELHSRSAAQQLDHWARIGREFESSSSVTHDEVERVLAGQVPYDDASERAQAAVRVEWDARLAERLASLDLVTKLRATGQPWVVGDKDGNAVMRSEPTDAAA
jgi:hypothetical protein